MTKFGVYDKGIFEGVLSLKEYRTDKRTEQ